MNKPTNDNNKVSNQFDKSEIDLHIAEYNVLSTKSTYLMSFQYIILTILVAGIVAMVGHLKEVNYFWGLILGIQSLALISGWFFYENYIIVRYIEKYLRPLIKKIIGEDSEFWNFGTYIDEYKSKNNFIWAELVGSLVYLIFVLLCFLLFHKPTEWVDWGGYLISVILFCIYSRIMFKTYKLRHNRWGTLDSASLAKRNLC